MRWVTSALRRPQPIVLAISAAFCAAILVLYFQHRALSTLESQTRVILRQISEQTAADIALEVRRTLDGPVFDTLTAVNHPDLREGRLDLVARQYEEGLHAYPHVERFVVWTAQTEQTVPGEALFYDRNGNRAQQVDGITGDFTRDAPLGREILALAHRYAPEQHIYVAAEQVGPRPGRQVFLRLFWTDARRVEYFAILGFLVDPQRVGERLFASSYGQRIGSLLQQRGGDAALRLRVIDEQGKTVYGDRDAPVAAAAAVAPLPLLFYSPDRIGSRLSGSAAPLEWRIEVTAAASPTILGVSRGYWPVILSVLLMASALGLTVLANRRAADLTRMQADFISHVSHQLKTPLSLLSAATETMTMDRVRSPEKLTQYVGIIRGEVTRLSALVQRILEFSRLEQQRDYEFEDVDLTALVCETVAAFESSLSGQHFAFDVSAGRVPLHVSADPAAIEQALVNLLDNAVKYSRDVRKVTVSLRALVGDAAIEVRDAGIGIDPADQRRIFEKFYRGAGATRHSNGFGLGLSIAQQLVIAHGGRLEVESTPGRGSTFRVLLPLTVGQRVESGRASASAAPTENAG